MNGRPKPCTSKVLVHRHKEGSNMSKHTFAALALALVALGSAAPEADAAVLTKVAHGVGKAAGKSGKAVGKAAKAAAKGVAKAVKFLV